MDWRKRLVINSILARTRTLRLEKLATSIDDHSFVQDHSFGSSANSSDKLIITITIDNRFPNMII